MKMFRTFFSRLVRVVRLDSAVYAEVQNDDSATWQAVAVVVSVALAHAILGIFFATRGGWNVLRSIIPGFQVEFVGWLIWGTIMYGVGTRIFKSTVTYHAVLRALGFAALPGILYSLGFISEAILVISWLWRIGTSFIAMRQVLGLGLIKSITTFALGGVGAFLIGGYATVATLQVLDWIGIR